MADSKNVLVIGASIAGLPLSLRLLASLPSGYTLTLLSPSDHVYWNIAAPRAIVSHAALDEARLFEPFLPTLNAHTNASRLKFVQGLATGITSTSHTVTYRPTASDGTPSAETEQTLTYSHLVLASGSRSADPEWVFKTALPHDAALTAIRNAQERIAAANTIVLSGAGATGIETAGEIKCAFPDKKVIILSSTSQVLPTFGKGVGESAVRVMRKLGIDVRLGVRVSSEDKEAGKLTLSDDTVIESVDLHLPTYGLFPNSEYAPDEWLDESGWVKVNEHMQVSAVTDGTVFAIGDVTSFPKRQAVWVNAMVPIVEHNLLKTLNSEGKESGKEGWKVYKENPKNLIIVPIGPKFGSATGELFGWRTWGWFGWLLKGRDYMIGGAKKLASGKS